MRLPFAFSGCARLTRHVSIEVEQTSVLCTEWMSTEADRGWVKAALDVMRKVKACDPSVKQWLCVPVPVEVVTDYPRVIFHPQDLGTIEAALKDNGYGSPDAWIAAVRTVFRNVFVYNREDGGVGSKVIAAADAASQMFEKEMLRLRGVTVI